MSIARLTAAASVLALGLARAGAADAQDFPLAPLENFGKVVVTARQSAGAITFEQAFGGEFDAEPASFYPESSELRRLGRAVGRLDVAFSRGVGYCTAFLISDRYLMTNAHCLEGGQVQSINFITGYVETGIEEGTRTYNVGTAPVEISASGDLDFAILQVFGNPAAEWGTLELAARDIDETRDAGMPLMVLGHPVFQVAPVPVPQALYVSRKECRATDSKPLAGKQMRHTCDTLNGNSGSPVFSDDTRQVIALHHAGSPREGINFAIPMTLIAQKSKVVAELLALAPAPDEGNAALAAQLAAAQAELERLRQQGAEAEAERRRQAEEAARKAAEKAEAERLARVAAEAERRKLAEQLAAWKAEAKRSAEPEGPALAADELDSTRLLDIYWEKSVRTILGRGRILWSAEFSPDGTRIVTASGDKTARVWDVATGQVVATLSGVGLLAVVGIELRSAAFSPDGTRVVTASGDGFARVWDSATGRQLRAFIGHGDSVLSAEFSPDGRRVVTASSDKTARVWDVATGRVVATLSGVGIDFRSAAFSPNGTRVVTACGDGLARVWDSETGRQLRTLIGHKDAVLSASYSPDGKRILTASSDKTARVWDAATGQQIVTLSGHSNTVTRAAFSPDGTLVVTASNDETARVWDVATGREMARLSGHEDWVNSAVFSPDGTQILTASSDGTNRIWGGY
ncbi:trypsin-like peptidase domain-containing protein [Maliponia aquimaris]|uniref:Serine protease n=1 Tax=Maliponia aquimaris TaxID=1673631 RepID=A0A238K1V1_9RHOB|nr:trypsin-like peptidase domain-containing protein [Maliponia aquimaris]SMX36855.1 translocation protein TolB [Maliponia aquimaris]